MALRILLAALAAFLLLPLPAAGQEFTWRQVAFAGAQIHALAVAAGGKVMYLSTDLGLHVSDDGGETWLYAGQELDANGAPPVVSLAVDPRDERVAYAGTEPGQEGGLYVTHDLGRRWQKVFSGERGDGVSVVALAPQEPRRILAVASAPGGRDDEIIASDDGGATWQVKVREGDGNARRFFALTWLDGEAQVAVAAGSLGTVYVSRDSARTWIAEEAPRRFMYGLASLLGRGSFLLASAERDLFISTTGGANWLPAAGPQLPTCAAYGRNGLLVVGGRSVLAFTRSLCRNEPVRVYAAMNGARAARGVVWRALDAGLPRTTDLALVPGVGGQVFALTADGLWQVDLPAAGTDPLLEPAPSPTVLSTPDPKEAVANVAPPEPPPSATPEPRAVGTSWPGGVGSAVVLVVSLTGLGAIGWFAATRRRRAGGRGG